MARPDTEDSIDSFRRYKSPVPNRLSEIELQRLDKELSSFKVVTSSGSRTDDIAWMQSRGALSKNGSIKIRNLKPAMYSSSGKIVEPLDCDPILYEQLQKDFEQWKQWKHIKNIGETKRIEQWDAMSKEEQND